MNEIASLKDVREQLSTVLSFFPRVDSKLSTVLAVDMAMLATLSASVPGIRLISVWSALTAILTVALLVASFLFLYFGAFPSLKGGHSSVIYFKDIAARNEGKFLEDYKRQTPDSLKTDILSQVWRNAEILSKKFRFLKFAFITMAFAIIPWGISLALFAMQRSSVKMSVIH